LPAIILHMDKPAEHMFEGNKKKGDASGEVEPIAVPDPDELNKSDKQSLRRIFHNVFQTICIFFALFPNKNALSMNDMLRKFYKEVKELKGRKNT
jgi:hypothetical protein